MHASPLEPYTLTKTLKTLSPRNFKPKEHGQRDYPWGAPRSVGETLFAATGGFALTSSTATRRGPLFRETYMKILAERAKRSKREPPQEQAAAEKTPPA